MKELSIFVDESGDFGEYAKHSPFYIISLVLHDQDKSINSEINHLEEKLANIGYPNHCIHTGPLIRQEDDYRYISIDERRKLIRESIVQKMHIANSDRPVQLYSLDVVISVGDRAKSKRG